MLEYKPRYVITIACNDQVHPMTVEAGAGSFKELVEMTTQFLFKQFEHHDAVTHHRSERIEVKAMIREVDQAEDGEPYRPPWSDADE